MGENLILCQRDGAEGEGEACLIWLIQSNITDED